MMEVPENQRFQVERWTGRSQAVSRHQVGEGEGTCGPRLTMEGVGVVWAARRLAMVGSCSVPA
jgi:hypothetical protein